MPEIKVTSFTINDTIVVRTDMSDLMQSPSISEQVLKVQETHFIHQLKKLGWIPKVEADKIKEQLNYDKNGLQSAEDTVASIEYILDELDRTIEEIKNEN